MPFSCSRWASSASVYPATMDVNEAAMESMTPVPAPPPGDPVDSAKALVHSSTVDICVVTDSESFMPSSVPGLPRLCSFGLDTLARPRRRMKRADS